MLDEYRAAQLHQGDQNKLQLQRFEGESATFLNLKGCSYVQTVTTEGKSVTIKQHLVSDQTKKNQARVKPEKQLTLKVLLNEAYEYYRDKIMPVVASKVYAILQRGQLECTTLDSEIEAND